MRRRTSLHGNDTLRRLLRDRLPAQRFEDLAVPFECVAASIERAREHWFSTGDLIEPILASCALPGVFPPVRIGDEHFFDGGLVNSIPLARRWPAAPTPSGSARRAFGGGTGRAAVFVAGRVRGFRDFTSPPFP
jgi:predicted acylesterase/phospholipase RssA